MALKKLLFYFVLSIAGLLVASTVKSLLTDKLTHSTGYFIENNIIQNTMSSGFKLESFNDFIYIRDKNNNNVAVTKAKEYKLKPGKYSLSTALGKLGKFRVRKNTFIEINASDYLQSVQFINISDKAYLYGSQKIKPYSPGLRNKKNTIAIHTLYADQGIDEVVFNNEVLQLPFGKFRLHIDGKYDNRNYFDFQVQKNTPQIIDFKDHFAYLNIPSDYKRGNIRGTSKSDFYNKCCTVNSGKYTITVDDQVVSEINAEAGEVYDIASRSQMSSVSVSKPFGFKITGNGVNHNFGISNAKLTLNLIPNIYELHSGLTKLADLELSGNQHIILNPDDYFGNLTIEYKKGIKQLKFDFIDTSNSRSAFRENGKYLITGNYNLMLRGEFISNFFIKTGETTTVKATIKHGEVVLKNHDRPIYNLYESDTKKYIDQLKTYRNDGLAYLLPGNYCLRESNNRNNGSIGAIIKCFEVFENETTVVDLHSK